jgi:hypothetical protein
MLMTADGSFIAKCSLIAESIESSHFMPGLYEAKTRICLGWLVSLEKEDVDSKAVIKQIPMSARIMKTFILG